MRSGFAGFTRGKLLKRYGENSFWKVVTECSITGAALYVLLRDVRTGRSVVAPQREDFLVSLSSSTA